MKKIINYFKESWSELSKVVWPTRKQVIEMTLAVVVLTILVSTILGFYDFGLSKALSWLLSFKK
jgi:preprotein translocase subunit SecE